VKRRFGCYSVALENLPAYSFAEDLETIQGWSAEKEQLLIQSLKADGLYCESEFYTYQSIIESLLPKILKLSFSDRGDLHKENHKNDPHFLKDIWLRLQKVQDSLTEKQTELVDLLYLNRPMLTYEEVAAKLNISFDSVRDREACVIIKMKKEFIEFTSFSPYKDYHKNNQVIWSYIGCRHNPTAEKIHPCYRVKIQNGVEVKEFITHGDLLAEKLKRTLGLMSENEIQTIEILNRQELEPLYTADNTTL